MIQLENVEKIYDDGFQALKNINLHFREGEINVLIGPSGCGKTTTMKLLNRLNEVTSGTVYVNGEDISKIDPVELRRKTGYVIQHIGLFPHMTIAENVAAVPKLLKWNKERIDQRVDELLNLVNLAPETYRDRYPSELSGGQQQRIGVIRALAAEPPVVLMDEPFSALDPISREQLQDELIRLQKEIKKTFIFVTHDIDEALKIADQIILMKDGEVVQCGSPEEILRHPANDFVVEFIGKKRLEQQNGNVPTVDEVMVENPVTSYPTRGLAQGLRLMEQKRVDSLIVVDEHGEFLGHAPIFNVLAKYREEGKTLADVMVPIKHIVSSGTSLKIALDLMNEYDLRYVPVVNGKTFLGVITRGSVVRLLADVYSDNGNEGIANDTAI
ncbi:betaine/proline/choline family ABC transporter ATP-binding protein [Alkalihalobacterium alkalinitrilicum]|uniref:betaine/proline/choline family ABC transporter ATP-binding protein n=1 Tax=Alkalihalobacterium alkalinitrilicum TaxID=427920 RepID=UPI000994A3BE|nr:betaine/proline/choline family ABC transporter ATP-binding protein [Alkalihalobacterium alkalinitrilicum]